MVLFNISCISPHNQAITCDCIDEDFEAFLETLSQLVQAGWTIVNVKYVGGGRQAMTPLPIEAFDGSPMREPIKKLQREWQTLLEMKNV